MGYLYIGFTILFTVYGQMVLKWQVGLAGPLPDASVEKVTFLLRLLLNPWVFSGFCAAFLASLAWMAAMTRFQLGYAYPFMSLNFVLVLGLSAWIFQEPVSIAKVIGITLVVLGIIVGSQE